MQTQYFPVVHVAEADLTRRAPAFVWPLDVGPRTIAQMCAANPKLSRKTIWNRLEAGCRVWARLIENPHGASEKTPARLARSEMRARARRNADIIERERTQYFAKRKAAHPPV